MDANSFYKKCAVGLLGAVVLLVVVTLWKDHRHQAQLVDLRNQIAQHEQTIEIKDGLYRRAAAEASDVKNVLDQRDKQIKDLVTELKRNKEKLLTASSVIIRLKKDLAAEATAHQTSQTDGRIKVDFTKDFGYLGVSGYTLTNPAYAWVKIQQNRPLKLTVAVSRGPDGRWNTYVTSSESDVTADVVVSAVDPQLLRPKWYERMGVLTTMGFGTRLDDVSLDLGLAYSFKRFDLGIGMAGATLGNLPRRHASATLIWHPLAK